MLCTSPLRTCLQVWGPAGALSRHGALRFYLATHPLHMMVDGVHFGRFQSSSAAGLGGVGGVEAFLQRSCKCGGGGVTKASSLSSLPGEQVRFYSEAKRKPSERSLQEVSESRGGAVTLSTAEKVKENVKTVSYGGVIVVGVIIGGAMLYYVLNELLSGESPNNIYSHAFKMCKLSTEVQDALGAPIKCYGEETRRGWRRHVAFQEFLAGETKFIRMRFYIEGPFKKGTVNVEKKTNDRGKYEYTYITVDVDGYPPRRLSVPF